MKLPNGHLAIVDDEKLYGYVLNPNHPVGRHHAVLFERLLGISAANADVLKKALLFAAANQDISVRIRHLTVESIRCDFP